MRFSLSNVDKSEHMFKLEHDVAMGYKPPAVPRVPKVKTALDQFMEDHPVPSPLHESFRCWIAWNAMAKFDCFEDPNYLCECYKCAMWQKQEDYQYTIMEFAKSEHETLMLKTDVSGVSAVDRFMKTEQEPSSRTVNNMPSVQNTVTTRRTSTSQLTLAAYAISSQISICLLTRPLRHLNSPR